MGQGDQQEQGEELVLVADDRGRFVEVNDRAVEVLGYSREDLLEMSVFDLTPAARQIDGYELWQQFMRSGQQSGEYVLRAHGGRLLRFSYSASVDPESRRHVSRLRLLGPVKRG